MKVLQAPQIDLWIAGTPRGKDRPRFSRATGRTFTTKQTVNAEANIVQVWREAGEPRLPDGPAMLFLFVRVERPASHFKRDGALSAEGRRRDWPDNKKPDLDNALKLAMDALNGRAYKDDVQIVASNAFRVWGARPGVRVIVTSLVDVVTV